MSVGLLSFASVMSTLGHSVLNFNGINSGIYLNLAKSFQSFGMTVPADYALLNADQYPVGTLSQPSGKYAGATYVDPTYYGHFTLKWTGVSCFSMGNFSQIIYSGGAGIYGVTPSASGTFGGGAAIFWNNTNQTTNMNVEFAFGVLLSAVGTSVGGDIGGAGLVKFTCTTSTFTTGTKVKLNNGITGLPAGPNADGSWTVNAIDTTHFSLQGSSAYAGSVTITGTGGPGTQSEAIQALGAGGATNLSNVQFFGNLFSTPINHAFSNFIFCKTADLTAIGNGKLMVQPVIDFITAYKPRYVRFMDHLSVQGNYSSFTYRSAATALFYGNNRIEPAYFGTTGGTANAITITNPSGSPASGAYVDGEVGQFVAASNNTSRNPTLQFGARGAKPMTFVMRQLIQFINVASPLSIGSFSGSGTTVTVTTAAPHGLTNGAVYDIVIAGATPSGFNGEYLCTITGAATFTYANTTSGTASVQGTYQVVITPGDVISLSFINGLFTGTYVLNYECNTAAAATSFQGTISGNTLTASSVTGKITRGQLLTYSGSNGATYILANGTGTGGAGTYTLTSSPGNIGSPIAMTSQGRFGPDTNINILGANYMSFFPQDPTITATGIEGGNPGAGACYFYYNNNYPSGTPTTFSPSVTGAGTTTLNPSTMCLSTDPYANYYGSITAGQVYSALYSKLLDSFIIYHGPMNCAQPLETVVEICTRTNVGAYLCCPISYTDSAITSLGGWAATNLPGLPVAFEFSNELWNSGEAPHGYTMPFGKSLGFAAVSSGGQGYLSFVGLRSAQAATLFRSGWTGAGRSRSDLMCTMGCNAVEGNAAGGTGQMVQCQWNGQYLVTSNTTYAAVGGAGWNTSGIDHSTGSPTFSRPIDYFDAVAYAPYSQGAYAGQGSSFWTGTLSDFDPLLTASSNYAYGGSSGQTSGLNAWDTDYRSATYTSGGSSGRYGFNNLYWYTFADPIYPVFVGVVNGFENYCAAYDGVRAAGYPNLSVIQYEGGCQQTLDSTPTSATTNPGSIAAMTSQLTGTGWNLSPYTNGAGSVPSTVATNLVNLAIAYQGSAQFQASTLWFWNKCKTIHAARPLFCPATYGIEGPSVWQQFVGSIATAPLGNELASVSYNHT